MKLLLLPLLILLSFSSYAQSSDFQKMKFDIDTCTNDSLKSLLYGRLAMRYLRSNPDSAIYYIKQGETIANTIGNKTCQATMYNGLGNIHFFQSNYDSCISYYSKCLEISTALQDSLRMGAMYSNIGLAHSYQAKYDTALSMLQKAHNIRRIIDDERITGTINNIGLVYQKMKNWEKALEYYTEAARLKEAYDQKLSLSNTLNNIGIILKKLDRDEEAIPYYEQSLAIAVEFEDKIKQANAHNNLASLYHDIPAQLQLAGTHYQKSIALKESMGDKAGLANTYSNYAEWLVDTDNPATALGYINKALDLNEEIDNNLYSSKITKQRASIYQKLKDYPKAYEALADAYALRESEMTEDLNNKIADLEVQFETAEKEAEIARLSLENQLKTANLARSQNLQLAVGTGAVMTILILVIFYTQRNKKLRLEREAQELQMEALKKRFMELHASPAELAVSLNFDDLNNKLNTPLTEREFETLKLSIEGKSNAEISEQLFISLSTVKFHLRNTYSKMGVGNRKEAFQYMLSTS